MGVVFLVGAYPIVCKNTNVVVAKNATTSQKWIATPYYSEISSVAEKIHHIFQHHRNSHIISNIKAGR